MTTLADMNQQERAQCRGMWVTYQSPMGEHQAIYEAGSTLLEPGYGRFKIPLKNITPCYDLPRAWAPDGQPPAGQWEDGHVVVSYDDPDPGILKNAVSIEGLSEGGMSYYDAPPNGIEVKLDKFGEGEGKARRWVGEWETVEEGEDAWAK